MVKCKWCDQEMTTADGCDDNEAVEYEDGTCLLAIPFGDSDGDSGEDRCPDCNVEVGYNHHPGCDNEICPRCGSQIISCDCGVVN